MSVTPDETSYHKCLDAELDTKAFQDQVTGPQANGLSCVTKGGAPSTLESYGANTVKTDMAT